MELPGPLKGMRDLRVSERHSQTRTEDLLSKETVLADDQVKPFSPVFLDA